MIKICIWMNRSSHHQSPFFEALNARGDVDLQVCYFQPPPKKRLQEGWSLDIDYREYENLLPQDCDPIDFLAEVDDWEGRFHIINDQFSQKIVDYFCEQGVRWFHWSEMSGIRLAELLGYRMTMFRWVYPFLLQIKRPYGLQVGSYAVGALAQGRLAGQSFRMMGVPNKKIVDLYYTPAPLPESEPAQKIVEFAQGRKVFLSVAALCPRKGIVDLLGAFSKVSTNECCLVLCGLDKENGRYQKLTSKLGLENHVLFLGIYPGPHIAEVYAASDVFVLASRFDGWGVVLNEAASLGLPLVATDMCGAAWHLIEVGKNGYRVKTGSVLELARKMSVYVQHPKLIKEHGKHSRELFFREFTPECNTERLVQAILGFEGQINS